MKIIFEDIFRKFPSKRLKIARHISENPVGMANIHYHPCYEIYILVKGSRKYFLSDRILSLKPVNVLIIKPNEVHRAIPLSNEKYERFLINVHPSMVNKLLSYNNGLRGVIDSSFYELDALDDLLMLIDKMQSTEDEAFLRHYLEAFLILLQTKGRVMLGSNALEKSDMRIQDAIDYIAENFSKKITLKECADISNMSTKSFTRIFGAITNTTLKAYINSLRIKKACELKENTKLSILEVALEVGYNDHANFSTLFRQYIGVPPSQYRKNTRKP